MLFRTVE